MAEFLLATSACPLGVYDGAVECHAVPVLKCLGSRPVHLEPYQRLLLEQVMKTLARDRKHLTVRRGFNRRDQNGRVDDGSQRHGFPDMRRPHRDLWKGVP